MKCPCQSDKPYAECCEQYHKGEAAPTAEALMRSRYSAYVVNDDKYLYKSWSKTTRPSKKSLRHNQNNKWLGLTIVRTELGSIFDSEGVVEFIARFQENGQEQQLHEVSRFFRENGKWVYLDGEY
jgi:SEC-C motif-containing protein